ncbi:MAG: 2-isopropylmalate synthase, partial [Betaproteobacteria bacterium]|nr:2-isopropylmalate synthase [Betaproteobacteria bacterium]
QVEFSSAVQRHTDAHGGEMNAAEIWALFSREYLETGEPVRYVEHHLFEHGQAQGIRLTVESGGVTHLLSGEGNGPIDAAVHALRTLGIEVQVRSYEERSLGRSQEGGNAQACAIMEVTRPGNGMECHGVGLDPNIVTASVKALVSGVNRLGATAFSEPQVREA